MEKARTLEELQYSKKEWMHDCAGSDIGQFNVFRLDPFVGANAKPVQHGFAR